MKSWIKWQKDHSERFTESILNEVKNPYGYEVPSTSEIYHSTKGYYRTSHDAWEAARKAKNHYDEYHGEDDQNFSIEKKDKPCTVCGWPFKPNEQVTFTVTQPPKIKKLKHNYGKNADKFKYKASVVLKTDRPDGGSATGHGWCNFIYYIYTSDIPSSADIPVKEGDTVTGKTPFYYGSPSYGWYIFLNNVKVVNEDEEKSAFSQSEPATFTASSLFKKEMQSKKNPSETYFLYTAKDENGQKYSWFSKENFNDGDKVTGTMDSIYGNAIKLKGVKLAESKLREDIDNQSDDIDMFVRDWIDNLVKPYIYDHDVEGLASELASVTDRIVEWDSDEVIDELGYEPDWDLFREICDNIVEETVGDLTYKEGFEDLNELFCQEFD